MNPELYERYLAKKAKKLGISVEEAAKQLGSQAAKSEEQMAGGQEGKPLTVESGKWKVESLSSLAPSSDGEGCDGVISTVNSEISQIQQNDKNPSTLQPFNPYVHRTHPTNRHRQARLARGGACPRNRRGHAVGEAA